MSIFSKSRNITQTSRNITRGAAVLAVAAGLSLAAGTAFADDPTTMAPPVQSGAPEFGGGSLIDNRSGALDNGGSGVNASADSVFNWQEVPADQQVPLTRATFDQGGYQLYDTQGETIVVPFTNQNLYVMKFAASPNGTLYFENTGGYPVLYVPSGGFVENATVSGARWYPFGKASSDFHPAEPVFLGIAPSYPEFIDLGWYPDTYFYGGYYGHTSFLEGGVFLPTVGLFFSIGGHPYYGWNGYHRYYEDHPGFHHISYYNRNFYHYAGSNYRTFASDRRFGGGYRDGGGFSYHSNGNRYYHAGGSYAGRAGFVGRSGFGGNSNGRTFRGASGFGGGHAGGIFNHSGGGSFSHNGGQNFGGGQHGGIGGAQTSTHTFRGSFGGGQNGQHYSGGQPFGGGSQNSGSSRSFGGGSHSFSGGSRIPQRRRTLHSVGGSRRRRTKRDGGGHQDSGGGRSR